jgi:DNA-binding NarL/FixJ family response regulator
MNSDDVDDDFQDGVSVEELRKLLGDDDAKSLFVFFGGLRLYIAQNVDGAKKCGEVLSPEGVAKLAANYGRSYIRVPLAREFLALKYFEAGMNNREVAILLRITESGVERLKSRLRKKGLLLAAKSNVAA